MSLKYKIAYVSPVDRFTGMPVPAEHRVYFVNEFQNALKSILFGDEFFYTELSPVKDIIDFIRPYDELVEELVKNNVKTPTISNSLQLLCRAWILYVNSLN